MNSPDTLIDAGSAQSRPSSPFDYDWLFAASGEPVLIVDTDTARIVEANPSALRLLHASGGAVIGMLLTDVFAADCAALIAAGLTQALVERRTTLLALQARKRPEGLRAHVSLFRSAARSYFLVRLAPNDPALLLRERRATRSVAFNALDGAPFGFVMTNAAFRIDYANRAFVAMLNRRSQAEVVGRALEGCLALTAGDRSTLRQQMARRIALTRLVTLLRRRHQAPSRVAVEAICVAAGADSSWGFAVKETPAPH